MLPLEKIHEYCNKVCEQIRWKKAKPGIAREIKNHLCDQRDAYLAAGDTEESATEKAIVQMGDAVSVGAALDKMHKPRAQWLMLFLTGIFMLMGMAGNFLIAYATSAPVTFQPWGYVLSFCVFLLFYFIDFTAFGKIATQTYFVVLLLAILGFFTKTYINGRLAWSVGPFTVSMEYLCLVFSFAYTLLVYGMRTKGMLGILLCGVGYVPYAMILLLVPTLSGLVLYTVVGVAALCFAIARGWFGVRKKQGLLLVLVPTAIASGLIASYALSPYRRHLWQVFLNPLQDKWGSGFQYYVFRSYLSEAVFFGQGGVPQEFVNQSVFPYENSYTLLALIHRFGFVVLLAVVLCILAFSAFAIAKACKQKSVLGAMLALTVIGTFTLQAVFYIVANLGYGLVSPMSLPLIAGGNVAMLLNAALVGIMLSVFRTGDIVRDHAAVMLRSGAASKDAAMFCYEDGKLIIDFKAGRAVLADAIERCCSISGKAVEQTKQSR